MIASSSTPSDLSCPIVPFNIADLFLNLLKSGMIPPLTVQRRSVTLRIDGSVYDCCVNRIISQDSLVGFLNLRFVSGQPGEPLSFLIGFSQELSQYSVDDNVLIAFPYIELVVVIDQRIRFFIIGPVHID